MLFKFPIVAGDCKIAINIICIDYISSFEPVVGTAAALELLLIFLMNGINANLYEWKAYVSMIT